MQTISRKLKNVKQFEEIINKVEKKTPLTTDENTLISTHLHGIVTDEILGFVTDEIVLRIEMYDDVINAQYKKIDDLNSQGRDDDDIKKKIAKCRKTIELFVSKVNVLEQFARANTIVPVRGVTDDDTDSDF